MIRPTSSLATKSCIRRSPFHDMSSHARSSKLHTACASKLTSIQICQGKLRTNKRRIESVSHHCTAEQRHESWSYKAYGCYLGQTPPSVEYLTARCPLLSARRLPLALGVRNSSPAQLDLVRSHDTQVLVGNWSTPSDSSPLNASS